MYKFINKQRLVDRFVSLAEISSPSWKEHEVIDYIRQTLSKLNVECTKYKCGDSFNLYARMQGSSEKKGILFSCHTDTVTPCDNIKPIVNARKIYTDGTTILGADDKAAIAVFLEAVECIKENNIKHGPIEFIFSCAEEIGLNGIKAFDLSLLKAKYAFVFDTGGKVGQVVLKAPFHISLDISIKGRAAHAGIAPESGISAIRVASEIISKIPHGRIDSETTVNVGLISGGRATNIVAEDAHFELEARSISIKKLSTLESRIKKIIDETSKKHKAKIKIIRNMDYEGYSVAQKSDIVNILNESMRKIKIKPVFTSSGGGSDTNIISKAGIKAVNLSIGMQRVHTTNEYIDISDLLNGTKLVLSIVENI